MLVVHHSYDQHFNLFLLFHECGVENFGFWTQFRFVLLRAKSSNILDHVLRLSHFQRLY